MLKKTRHRRSGDVRPGSFSTVPGPGNGPRRPKTAKGLPSRLCYDVGDPGRRGILRRRRPANASCFPADGDEALREGHEALVHGLRSAAHEELLQAHEHDREPVPHDVVLLALEASQKPQRVVDAELPCLGQGVGGGREGGIRRERCRDLSPWPERRCPSRAPHGCPMVSYPPSQRPPGARASRRCRQLSWACACRR